MSSYTLNIQVEGGEISADHSLLVADSVEYIVAAFTFDESWTDLYKTAVFRVGELVYHSPLENNACKIPFEALKEPIMYVSVFGVLESTRATTAELPIQVQNSGYTVCEPSAPTPDPYNYFIERVTELKNEAVAAANQSLGGAESAEANANIATEMRQSAEKSEQKAAESSNSANLATEQSSKILEEVTSNAIYITEIGNSAQEAASSAAESAEKAQSTAMDEIENHNSADNALAHPNILSVAEEAKSIALGKANSICFDTEQQLKNWVAGNYRRSDGKTVADLKTGDNLYILELGVPDYWWDGSSIQPLGAEKPDFSDYYTKAELNARLSDASFDIISRSEYNTLYSEGSLDAGRIYFVFEEE